ncbi:MAG: precorrin-6y C5,15-methyltransferase (decarboxylating) subunit CbiE, partial [Haloechinothrix sp.]
EVLFGSVGQLELIPEVAAKRVAWPSPLLPQLDALIAGHAGSRTCVLASGDPLLSGIGTTLVRRFGSVAVRVLPAVSSVTLARARLGWSFEETEVISSVGRSVHRVARALAPGARVLVLSSDESTPAEIASLLTAHGYGTSTLIVLENLDSARENRVEGVAREWTHPPGAALNVVAFQCAADPGVPLLPLIAGLPDDAFEHDGQLTKRDLRASALARLAPMPGQLLWDVGAGAGSVAVEWSRAHPLNRAIAFERDGERCDRIERNARRLGVPELRVATGDAPDVLAGKDHPDAIFVGGGVSVPGMLDACLAALAPGGRLVAHAVTLESEQALARAHREHGGELTRIAVEHAAPLGGFTGWQPARTVTQWTLIRPYGGHQA